mgnify:CR=1 FL=1
MLPVLDAGMKNYAEVTAKVIGKDNQNAAGAGAAGGLGFAFLNYLDGELTPGIQLILDAVHIEDEMKDADVVVTGEGRRIIRLPWESPGGRCEAWQEIWRKNHCICRKRYERGSCLQ